MGDVGADTRPVRRQGSRSVIADPGLQIRRRPARELEGCSWRCDGLRSRKPEEVASRQGHLGTKEIVITGAHKERRSEGDVDLDLFPRDRTFASGELRNWVNAIYHGVGRGERLTHDTGREADLSERGVESRELIITGGIDPRQHAHIGRVNGVHGKDVIQLYLDAGDAREQRPGWQ